jgi:glycosyltransferase involved in cell wall biosynthesis
MNRALRKFKPDFAIFYDHGAPGLCIKKIHDCKFIWISHHNPSRFADISEDILFSKRDISTAMKLENKALNKFDIAICPSNYMKDVFLKSYKSVPEKIIVIPNLINLDLIEKISKNDFTIGMNPKPNSLNIYIPSAGSVFKGSKYLREIILELEKKQIEN